MLEALDGVVLAVRDRDAAAARFQALFGAEALETSADDALGADVGRLALGTNVVRLASPSGAGPIAEHLERWGEGIVGAVFSTRDVGAMAKRFEDNDIGFTESAGVLHMDPGLTHGLLTGVTEHVDRERVGAVSFLYEVTHLVADWQSVSDFWTKAFGLDGARYSPIKSEHYGYDGMLTLFNPPDRLDRIEVVHPYDTEKAMGRFFVKRGEGPYMFYMETDDTAALGKRLDDAGARYAGEPGAEAQSLFVHPSSTHGVLIGVSATNVAWRWSGRPELAESGA